MMENKTFAYAPNEYEAETASNSYLISLVVIIVGLPLPIATLIGTIIFYLSNRKSPYFVRWHCTQALLSQLSLFFVNSIGFWWTVSIVYFDGEATPGYFVYLSILLLMNLIEFIATIYTSIEVRKGNHVEWLLYGKLTHEVCKPEASPRKDELDLF